MDTVAVPVRLKPEVVQIGLNEHGRLSRERFRMSRVFGLHFYHYHGAVEVDGRMHRFAPGAITVTPPEVELVWHFPRHAAHHYAHIHFPEHQESHLVELPVLTLSISSERRKWLLAGFEAAITDYAIEPARTAAWIWHSLWNLVPQATKRKTGNCSVAGRTAGSGERLHPALHTVFALIDDGLDQPLVLGALAAKVGLTKEHLIRLFQRHRGLTVMGYIRQRRMERARELLLESSMPVQAVARSVGISDLQRFNKMVRSHWGAAPTALRRK